MVFQVFPFFDFFFAVEGEMRLSPFCFLLVGF
jgi:hypothetical protein